MQLIGSLDSPYVRRVAIALTRYGVVFEHRSLSAFDDCTALERFNPTLEAPTLLLDDGEMLMDSSLILDYFESQAERRLLPITPKARARALHIIGLALVACEKTVQIVNERQLRPACKQYQPWLTRIGSQLNAAYRELERMLEMQALPVAGDTIDQAGITLAVAWSSTRCATADVIDSASFPRIDDFRHRAEALPLFRQFASDGATFFKKAG